MRGIQCDPRDTFHKPTPDRPCLSSWSISVALDMGNKRIALPSLFGARNICTCNEIRVNTCQLHKSLTTPIH